MQTYQTPEEMMDQFLALYDDTLVADWWFSKLQAREEWLKSELKKVELHYYTNPRGKKMVYLDDVLSLLTHKK